MNKIILLAKSHFKKNRHTAMGLITLMFFGALLLGLALLTILDCSKTAYKEAERLDSGHSMIMISDADAIDDEYMREAFGTDVDRYYIYRCLGANATVKFAQGDLALNVLVSDRSALDKKMGRTEIVVEDKEIEEKYIYLPYQYFTSGGYDIGDNYELELESKVYKFKVRGFLTSAYFGCNNAGSFEYIVDDVTYASMKDELSKTTHMIVGIYEVKSGVKLPAYNISLTNALLKEYPLSEVEYVTCENAADNRSFLSKILAIAFVVIVAIIAVVIALMLSNSIKNYVRENIKTIGVLKAIGYTSKDINKSIIFMFVILSVGGSLLGVLTSFALMPSMAKFLVAQMGIPYHMSFSVGICLITMCSIVSYTWFMTAFSLRKVKGIDPVIALKNGVLGHNFRKNHLRLDSSKAGLNVSIALKSIWTNAEQNIITFVVTGIVVFACAFGLLVNENFNKNPKLEILSLETFGGMMVVDNETKVEGRALLENIDGVTNVREVFVMGAYYKNQEAFVLFSFEDMDRFNNKGVCYKGRLPKYDNELAVSGKFAKEYNLELGSQIPVTNGNNTYTYLITGFIQSTNNLGREMIMSIDALKHIYLELDNAYGMFYFDTDSNETTKYAIEQCNEKIGDHVVSTVNFYEVMSGAMTTFSALASLLMIVICSISFCVVFLVLYLLIKSYIYGKRTDFGIYKAIGYTTNQLMLQTAISFMPPIIMGVIVSAFVSSRLVNSFMNMCMGAFGVVRCNFYFPLLDMCIVGALLVGVSFGFAMWQARKIKAIEPYDMLMGD